MSKYLEMSNCVLCGRPASEATVLFELNSDQKLLRCGCGLIYNDRCRADIEDLYDSNYYEGWEAACPGGYFSYSQMERATNKTDRFASSFIRSRSKDRGGKIRLLDIGCGYGFFLKQFKGEPGMELAGIEASRVAADKAAEVADDIVHGRFEDVDFSQKSDFDFVAAFEVVEHLLDPVGFLKKANRVLKDGGHLFMSTPDIGSLWFKMLKKRWPGIHPYYHNVYFSKMTLGTVAEKCDFEIVKMRSKNYYYTNIRHVRKRLSELFPVVGKFFAILKPFDAITVPFLNGGDLQVILRKKRPLKS